MSAITDEDLLQYFPDVLITHDTKEFYRGLLRRELRFNKCADCGTWQPAAHPLCAECWSLDVLPTPVSGRGTVHLLLWLRQGPPMEGVDYTSPHPVATVELAEQPGLRFTSTVADAAISDLAIGDRVELTWVERLGTPYPVFVATRTTRRQQR